MIIYITFEILGYFYGPTKHQSLSWLLFYFKVRNLAFFHLIFKLGIIGEISEQVLFENFFNIHLMEKEGYEVHSSF